MAIKNSTKESNQDPLASLKANTEHLTKETPEGEVKEHLLRVCLPCLIDLSPIELDLAIDYLMERCSLPKKMRGLLKKEVEVRRKQGRKPQEDQEDEARKVDLDELRAQAQPLLECQDVLGKVCETIPELGFTGQEAELRLLYLAFTTRIFDKPVNVIVKGLSSAGKNEMVKVVASFFPDHATIDLTRMSDKALFYWPTPLSNRFLIITEESGMASDVLNYVVRSLISEGRVTQVTVEKNPQTGKHEAREVSRDGPTGFATTTTSLDLKVDNENRMFSIEADGSDRQTYEVIIKQGDMEVAQFIDKEEILKPFRSFQELLQIEKPQANITFAPAIAQGCKPAAVRLRRDFPALLLLIKAHAVLHRDHRKAGEDGRILANREDYAAVYGLVGKIIDYGVGQDVPVQVREVIKAVETLTDELKGVEGREGEINMTKLAEYMGVSKPTASRHARRALKSGYLRNKNQSEKGFRPRQGKDYNLVTHDPLPDVLGVLPTPDKVFLQTSLYPQNRETSLQQGLYIGKSDSYELQKPFNSSVTVKHSEGGSVSEFHKGFTENVTPNLPESLEIEAELQSFTVLEDTGTIKKINEEDDDADLWSGKA